MSWWTSSLTRCSGTCLLIRFQRTVVLRCHPQLKISSYQYQLCCCRWIGWRSWIVCQWTVWKRWRRILTPTAREIIFEQRPVIIPSSLMNSHLLSPVIWMETSSCFWKLVSGSVSLHFFLVQIPFPMSRIHFHAGRILLVVSHVHCAWLIINLTNSL